MEINHTLQIGAARLPTCQEWDALLDAVGGADDLLHWKHMYSWCQDESPALASFRAARGFNSARTRNYYDATYRYMTVGFRPAFDALDPDLLDPDGTIVTVGTLYMDGQPVRIPQNPVWNGDIQAYVPSAKLEMREALGDPAYQVKAIKAGNILIADRVLLKNISWVDIQEALPTVPEAAVPCAAMDSGSVNALPQADIERLNVYFPREDWSRNLWGFTCFSRQNYARVVRIKGVDEIVLGIKGIGGGCLGELVIHWYILGGKPVPQLEVYNDAWPLTQTPTFAAVMTELTQMSRDHDPTPDAVSALLIAHGFTDQSDRPLEESNG